MMDDKKLEVAVKLFNEVMECSKSVIDVLEKAEIKPALGLTSLKVVCNFLEGALSAELTDNAQKLSDAVIRTQKVRATKQLDASFESVFSAFTEIH